MKKIWDFWELKAIEYLKNKWYIILDTNFKFSRFWEIDIIAKYNWLYIFFEVKYRTSDFFWNAEEYINYNKLKKISQTIKFYCFKNNISEENIRFDILIIEKYDKFFRYKHYKNQEI